MNRAVLLKTKTVFVAALVALCVAGGLGAYGIHQQSGAAQTVVDTAHALVRISYHGQDGIDALTLLKRHAAVTTKHYSFGDLVTTINGSAGNGPKYWTFYINGKEASIGAGTYISKDRDILEWKLQ